MLVEEVPKSSKSGNSTVYFSSLINLTARPSAFSGINSIQRDGSPQLGQEQEDGNDQPNNSRMSKNRAKVNYNLNDLMNAQTQTNNNVTNRNTPLKSSQQIQLEKIATRRMNELNRETPSSSFDLPKNFSYQSVHSKNKSLIDKKSRLGNTPTTKKILAARRNLNSYFEEERNLMSVNSILSVHYQFLEGDSTIAEPPSKKQKNFQRFKPFKPRLKLCCICGLNSPYSRCTLCGLFSCSVKCNRLHQESRCI